MAHLERLRDFVVAATRIVESHPDEEAALLSNLRPLLAALVAQDDWLPEDYAIPDPKIYRQYLLHVDPLSRFCVVSFVWGPGQKTPVHDHRTWGLVGILRGAERSVSYEKDADGKFVAGEAERLDPGHVAAVSPAIGDVHEIANFYDDRPSISIHVYGGDIGAIRRATYHPETGEEKLFVSGYADTPPPDLWKAA